MDINGYANHTVITAHDKLERQGEREEESDMN